MRGARLRGATLRCVVAMTLALTAAACGSGDEEKSTGGLEKTEIKIGFMPIIEDAPVQLAIQKGLFKAEGLTVKTELIAGGADSLPKLKSGALDMSFGNYVSFLQAHAQGVLKLRIIAEAVVNADNVIAVMVAKDSPIRTPKDLQGKTIAVNTKRNIATLLVRAGLKPYGVEVDEDKSFYEAPFPNHLRLLKAKTVAASLVAEPFVTVQQVGGARVLFDTNQGATESFPISGYATTDDFIAKNPKTVAAFQRAMRKAQEMAANRAALQSVIPSVAKGVDANMAAVLNYSSFPTSLNTTRLQRVVDTMQTFGYIKAGFDVKPLIYGATG